MIWYKRCIVELKFTNVVGQALSLDKILHFWFIRAFCLFLFIVYLFHLFIQKEDQDDNML
jgi:hypothetical protein